MSHQCPARKVFLIYFPSKVSGYGRERSQGGAFCPFSRPRPGWVILISGKLQLPGTTLVQSVQFWDIHHCVLLAYPAGSLATS
jgi:hypothetical protein